MKSKLPTIKLKHRIRYKSLGVLTLLHSINVIGDSMRTGLVPGLFLPLTPLLLVHRLVLGHVYNVVTAVTALTSPQTRQSVIFQDAWSSLASAGMLAILEQSSVIFCLDLSR